MRAGLRVLLWTQVHKVFAQGAGEYDVDHVHVRSARVLVEQPEHLVELFGGGSESRNQIDFDPGLPGECDQRMLLQLTPCVQSEAHQGHGYIPGRITSAAVYRKESRDKD